MVKRRQGRTQNLNLGDARVETDPMWKSFLGGARSRGKFVPVIIKLNIFNLNSSVYSARNIALKFVCSHIFLSFPEAKFVFTFLLPSLIFRYACSSVIITFYVALLSPAMGDA